MKGFYACVWLTFVSVVCHSQTITSAQSGPWNLSSTWVGGTIPDALNSTSIVISAGHTVNYDAPVTNNVDQVSVDGTLTIDVGVTMTLANGANDEIVVNSGGELNINGTLAFGSIPNRTVLIKGALNNKGSLNGVSAAKLTFDALSTYNHQFSNGGTIPTASWNAASTVNITGYTAGNSTPPSGLNQTFGNFVWNCPGQTTTISLGGLPTSLSGDFRVVNTGTDALFYSMAGSGGTINIGGNFEVMGGTLGWTSGDLAASTINITKNLNITGGYFQLADDKNLTINLTGNLLLTSPGQLDFAAGGATTNLNIQGNYTYSGGDLYVNGGTGNLNFIGASTKIFTSETTPLGHLNYSVASLSTLDVSGDNYIGGGGTFTLTGTLRVGSTDENGALQTGTNFGNLRVGGIRTYSSNATIVYDGEGPQHIGNGFPSGGDVNLSIDNTTGVTLSTSLDIVALRTLNLASGNIVIGSQTLTINGTVTGTGGIIGGAVSKLVIGGTGNFGTLTFNGTNELLDLTLNRTGSGVVTLGGDLTILGTFTHTNGALALGAHTLTISGEYAPANPGPLSVTSASSVIIDGTGSLPSDVIFSGTELGTLTLNRAGSTLPTSSSIAIENLNLLSGTFDNGAGIAISANGTITRSGTTPGTMTSSPNNDSDAYNVVYGSGTFSAGPELPSNETALNNFTKSGGGTLTLTSGITVNGAFSLSSGTLNVGGNSITMNGPTWAVNGGTFTPGTGTVTFSNAGGTVLSGISTFNNLTISTGGAVSLSSGTTTIGGTLSNNGTLTPGTGTVIFSGAAGSITGTSTTSFNNLTITGTFTAPTLMNVGRTFTVSGTFTANTGTTVAFTGSNGSITGSPTFNHVNVTGTLHAPSTLTLKGDLLINGTFDAGNSGNVVVFNGNANQKLDRTTGSVATIDLNNLTINKPGGTFNVAATVTGTIFRLNRVFTISQNGGTSPDVDFDGPSDNGSFVLRSTSTATARVATVPANTTFQGNLYVERWVENTSGSKAWRSFCSPVIGGTVADWKNSIPVIGRFSDPSPGPYADIHEPSIYRYDETLGGPVDNRWTPWPNGTNPYTLPASSYALTNGRGYSVFVLDQGNPTLTVHGTLPVGNVVVNVTSTGSAPDAGYNLIGNPYPAPVNWNSVTRSGTVSPIILLKDNVGNGGIGDGTYLYYDPSQPGGGGLAGNFDGILASGQAFFVTASGAGTVTFTEASKSTDVNPTVVREGYAAAMKIRVDGNGFADETLIRQRETATEGYDFGMDATKLANDHIDLYSFFDDNSGLLAINSFGKVNCSERINIGLRKVTPGSHVFTFSDLESFTENYEVLLLDNFTGQSIDLSAKSSYSFNVTADTLSYGNDRFKLVIMQPGINTGLTVTGNDVCVGSPAELDLANSETNVEYFAAINGNKVSENFSGNGSSLSLFIPAEKLNTGGQVVMLMAQRPGCDPVPMAQTVDLTVHEKLTPSVSSASTCGSGSVSLNAGGAEDEGTYRWYETDTDVNPISGVSGSEFVTPTLDKTKTYYVAIANALGCEGDRVAVKAEVVYVEPASIEVLDDNTLKSNYSEGNQWYLNGEAIDGAVGQNYAPQGSGLYSVEVSTGACSTSAEFLVTGIEAEESAGVRVYPNPVIDIITVELPAGTPADVSVFDLLGRRLGNVPMTDDGKRQTGEFDLRGGDSGVYFVKILRGNVLRNYKIIKN